MSAIIETYERKVRDLPWSEYRATVVVELYRVRCPDCGVKAEKVPQLPSKAPFSERAELTARRHPVSHTKVTRLLRESGYSLQGNRKTEEEGGHPDRDAQFRHINRTVQDAMRAGGPVISVDTKKKGLLMRKCKPPYFTFIILTLRKP